MKRTKWWMGLMAAVGLAVGTQGQLQAPKVEEHGAMPSGSSGD